MQHDSVKKTLLVALVLCVFCSVLVSVATVSLKERQDVNKKLDIQKNLLLIAGLIHNDKPSKKEIADAFLNIEAKVIDLKSGEIDNTIKADQFDYKEAQKDPKFTERIIGKDLARIKIRSRLSKIYIVRNNGKVTSYVLPVHGKGLWSTLWGFLSLSPDTKTILGLGFYQHGETPGLGGEVDNPKWKSLWRGKKPFDESFHSMIQVIKGQVGVNTKHAERKVDGLSGASLTSRGVQGLVNFWLGENGYGPFLKKVRMNGVHL